MIPLDDHLLSNRELKGNPGNVYIGPTDNCWQIVQCGKEDTCAVFKEKRGRHCYLYDHTFCFGEDMGPFHLKLRQCVEECAFYKSLAHDIGAVWLEAHKRIADAGRNALESSLLEQALAQRAELLRQVTQIDATGERLDVVVFRLGNDHYAIEAQYIHEIRGLSSVTPVPCTPDFVLGVTTIRGSIFSVIDIRQSFEAEERTASPDSMFIVLSWNNIEVCLFVDAIVQKTSVPKEALKAPALGSKTATSAYIAGIFQLDHKMVTLINWDAYLSHGNIIIKDSDI